MKQLHMKKYLIFTFIIASSIIGLSFTVQEDGYKNLKVLSKKTTKDEMDVIMKSFSRSLGVKCNFCHAPTADGKHLDFASDANKHKDVARQMMKMTARINKKFFKEMPNSVTCNTCHNGHEEPASKLPEVKED